MRRSLLITSVLFIPGESLGRRTGIPRLVGDRAAGHNWPESDWQQMTNSIETTMKTPRLLSAHLTRKPLGIILAGAIAGLLLCGSVGSVQGAIVGIGTSASPYTASDGTVFSPPSGYSSFMTVTLNPGEDSSVAYGTVYLTSGETVNGFAGYDPQGRPGLDSGVAVEVAAGNNPSSFAQVLVLTSLANGNVNGFGVIDWTSWNYTAPSTGYYTIGYEVEGEGFKTPTGLFEPAVPEPSTWVAAAMTSLGAVFSLCRRQRRRSVTTV